MRRGMGISEPLVVAPLGSEHLPVVIGSLPGSCDSERKRLTTRHRGAQVSDRDVG